uniref:Uncharacterized protein n=1 Tax=Oryza glumipatula TaxID=40148 RepID=A0A0E0AWP7_9ORYZ
MTIKYRFSGTPLGLVRLGHSRLGSGPNPHGKSRRGKDTGPRKYRRSARFYPGPPRCFPLVIGREIFSFFGGEEKILLTRRHNERGRCGGDGCTARCDSDGDGDGTFSPPAVDSSGGHLLPGFGRKSERMVVQIQSE